MKILLIIFFLTLLPASIILAVDPYEIWHKTIFNKNLVSLNERYRNAGFIRKYLFSEEAKPAIVLVGSSMSQNIYLDDLKKSFKKENVVRLVASGSYPKEQYIQLKHALNSTKIDIVVWEMYRNWTDKNYDKYPKNYLFPSYLYDNSITNDWPIIFNDSMFRESIDRILGKKLLGDLGWSNDVNSVSSWELRARRSGAYTKWLSDVNREKIEKKRRSILDRKKVVRFDNKLVIPPSIDKYIIPLVKANPNTKFLLFFPPISIVRQLEDMDARRLDKKFKFERELVKLSLSTPNLHIHSFNRDYKTTNNMTNYKDSGHFNRNISLNFIERISSNMEYTDSLESTLLSQRDFIRKIRTTPLLWE
jgi:hypothetical protein